MYMDIKSASQSRQIASKKYHHLLCASCLYVLTDTVAEICYLTTYLADNSSKRNT